MKRKARIMKRARAQIEHNNHIAALAEEALSPTPAHSWSKVHDHAAFYRYVKDSSRIAVDYETTSLHGMTVYNVILDDFSKSWEQQRRAASIVGPAVLGVPVARARAGAYGVASLLLVPGLQESITKNLVERPFKEDLLAVIGDITEYNLAQFI